MRPTLSSNMAGPSLEDLTKVKCPPDKPYICLPYGNCYSHEEYCDKGSRTAVSCFPRSKFDEKSISSWCQEVGRNISQMLHPSCRLACDSRLKDAAVSQSCKDCSDSVCLLPWVIVVIVVALAIIITIVACIMCRRKFPRSSAQDGCLTVKVNEQTECPTQVTTNLSVVSVARNRTLTREGRQHDMGIDNQQQQSVVACSLNPEGSTSHSPTDDVELEPSENRPLLTGDNLNSLRSDDTDHGQTSHSGIYFRGDTGSGASTVTSVDDSGISPGSYDQADHVQQLANSNTLTDEGQGRGSSQTDRQTQGLRGPDHGSNQTDRQTQGMRGPDHSFYFNASIPDVGGHKLVTSLSNYKKE